MLSVAPPRWDAGSEPRLKRSMRPGGGAKAPSAALGHLSSNRRSRGQSVVEFVIILPLLLLMVLIALDFGRVFLGWVVLNNAARVGANYASLHPEAWGTPGDATRRATYENLVRGARQNSRISLSACDGAAVPTPNFPAGTDVGDFAEVTLDCGFTPITPFIGSLLPSNPLTVSARSVFAVRIGAVDAPARTPAPVCLASYTWATDAVNPLRVTFTDTTTGGSGGPFLWDFGDAQASTSQNPSHTYGRAGTFRVLFRVSGCVSYALNVTVTEPPPTPDPNATATPTPDPNATATPTAAPTPAPLCQVPAFIGSRKNDAAATWATAGFTTPLLFNPDPPGNWRIQAQSQVGGFAQACNLPVTLSPDPLPTPTP